MVPHPIIHNDVQHRIRRMATDALRPHRLPLAVAFVGLLVQSALLLPVPLLQGWALDRIDSGADHVTQLIALAFAASAACYLLRAAVGWAVASSMHRVSLEVVRDLTDVLHRKLQRQPRAYFDRHPTGDLLARLTGDVGSLLLFLNGGALQLVCDFALAAGVAAVLAWLDWKLALLAAAVVPLAAISHRRFTSTTRRLARMAAARTAALYALLSERLSAIRLVRAFAREPEELANLDRRLGDHESAALAVVRAGGWQTACAALIGGLGTVLVVGYGVVLVRGGRLTVGELLAFIALVAYLYQPIVRLAGSAGLIAGTLAAAERLVAVLDAPLAVGGLEDDPPRTTQHAPRPAGRLVFRDVIFAYHAAGPRVLDRISFSVEPGETVGIVGPSGSGKSTLLALAGRIYSLAPDGGEIRLDARNVATFDPIGFRRAVALVPQQPTLFAGTIRSNLAYAAPAAAEVDLWRVLEAVELANLVLGLPKGVETPVGERGFTLSGGQRQRLAIARALLTAPDVLLLDDCMSGLDAATEARVQAAIAQLFPGRTRLVVSHRAATLARCDRIIALRAGRIVGSESFGAMSTGRRRLLRTGITP